MVNRKNIPASLSRKNTSIPHLKYSIKTLDFLALHTSLHIAEKSIKKSLYNALPMAVLSALTQIEYIYCITQVIFETVQKNLFLLELRKRQTKQWHYDLVWQHNVHCSHWKTCKRKNWKHFIFLWHYFSYLCRLISLHLYNMKCITCHSMKKKANTFWLGSASLNISNYSIWDKR